MEKEDLFQKALLEAVKSAEAQARKMKKRFILVMIGYTLIVLGMGIFIGKFL